jgi:hypothetical protein
VWLHDPKLGEEDVRHLGVVVLASMKEHLADACASEGAAHRGCLDELGARAHD